MRTKLYRLHKRAPAAVVSLLALCLLPLLFIHCGTGDKVFNARPVPPFDPGKLLPDPSVKFYVLGDWGTGNDTQFRIARAMAKRVDMTGADACFLLGDNFYMNGVSDDHDPLWQERFENGFPREDFDFPFYAVLGNHDYWGDEDAQVAYSERVFPEGDRTRWRMPGRYWTATFTIPHPRHPDSVRVIGIDTEEMAGRSVAAREIQLRWLDSVLQASREKWRIVIGHHTVFSHAVNTTPGILRDLLVPRFEKYRVHLYLCGHDHNHQLFTEKNGVRYAIEGAGGSPPHSVAYGEDTEFAATDHGFAFLQCDANEMFIQFLDESGTVLYSATLQYASDPAGGAGSRQE